MPADPSAETFVLMISDCMCGTSLVLDEADRLETLSPEAFSDMMDIFRQAKHQSGKSGWLHGLILIGTDDLASLVIRYQDTLNCFQSCKLRKLLTATCKKLHPSCSHLPNKSP